MCTDPSRTDVLKVTADRRRVRVMSGACQRLTYLGLGPQVVFREYAPEDALPFLARTHCGADIAPAAISPGVQPPTSAASTAFWTCRRFSA